ncbi:PEP-CTERM sorting domain-containing protein [Calothrix sp. CCY 0018]|uniref:Npun_F0296 family exosortase-dependent surface protein n=1 Tax=Calothrix sp. CCY 0018 TaxID=3103864 RepID=UPI0039C757D6
MFKKLFSIAALSAIATVTYAGSAQAANFSYSSGIFRDSNVTNQGAFSENVNNPVYETFDFNDVSLPGNGRVKYSFVGSDDSKSKGVTSVGTGSYGPAGVNGEDNTSAYLKVFKGMSAVIETAKEGDTFNYFGINLGALSIGNTLEFFNGDTAVELKYTDTAGNKKSASILTYDILTALAPTKNNDEQNGFFEFFSEGTADNFDRIVISQLTGGGSGFETDNHTFRIGTGKFVQASVPESSIALGMLAFGGSMLLGKRKEKKSVVK